MLPFPSHPASFNRIKPEKSHAINQSNTPPLPGHSLICKPRDYRGLYHLLSVRDNAELVMIYMRSAQDWGYALNNLVVGWILSGSH